MPQPEQISSKRGGRQIGERDKDGQLRITMITGIDRRNPSHYRVIVGTNVDWNAIKPGGHLATVSRLCTMTPDSSLNLDQFVHKYQEVRGFWLAPGYSENGRTAPTFQTGRMIYCRTVNIRPAWEVGEHDLDSVGIRQEDEVIIPDDVEAAPVLRTLERIAKRRREVPVEPRISEATRKAKIGRNAMCPCGSGKKFKRCHGSKSSR